MPTYRVTDPKSGRTVRLTGGTPPTEQELEGIFAQVGGSTPTPTASHNPLGDLRLAPLGPRLRELPNALLSAADTASFGLIPNGIARRFPAPEGAVSTLGAGAMQAGALAWGGPAKLAGLAMGGVNRLMPGLASNMLGRAMTTGVGGAVDYGTSDVTQPSQILPRAGIGFGIGATAGPVMEAAGKVGAFQKSAAYGKQLENSKVREAAVKEVQTAYTKTRPFQGKVTDRYADRLAAKFPQRRVNHSEPLADIQHFRQTLPTFDTALQGELKRQANSQRLQSIFNQPDVAADLPLAEARQVRQVIGKLYEKYGARYGRPVDDLGLAVQESYHALRAKELEAFPELKRAYKAFSDVANRLKSLRGSFSDAAMQNTITSNFSDNAVKIEAAKKLSPKAYARQEQIRKAIQARRDYKSLRNRAALGIAGTAGAGAIFETARRATHAVTNR